MTAKRFTHKINQLGMQFICYDDKAELLGTFADADGVTHIVKLLNELHEENQSLKLEIEKVVGANECLLTQKRRWEECSDNYAKLYEENEQLKQRNDRQAKRLAELYELMAKKDWESLTEIIDDFCSCEEQLQRESGTYGDWND